MLEVCYNAVWVVDAPWGRGVFSTESLPCANLTSVIKRSLGPRPALSAGPPPYSCVHPWGLAEHSTIFCPVLGPHLVLWTFLLPH